MPDSDSGSPISCELLIVENDSRAKQFACKIIIGNHTPHAVDILAINYRLGRGVSMQMNEDNSFVDLKDEYDTQKYHVKYLIHTAFMNASENFRSEYVRNSIESFRKQLSTRTILNFYLHLFVGRIKAAQKLMKKQFGQLDFPISNAKNAKDAITTFSSKGFLAEGVTEILNAKIDRMAAIEGKDQNFLRPEYVTQLQPNESYERVFVLKATRRFASVASYSVAFDTKLNWSEGAGDAARVVERIVSRSTSFNVTPSPVTLSIYAIIFSTIGVLLATLPNFKGEYAELISLPFVKQYFVGGALAVIIYNSLEMTELGDKVHSISWRSAMFVGVLCGLLSERMLQAITGFVK